MAKPNFKIDEIVLVMIVAVIAMLVSISNKVNESAGVEAEKIAEMILDDHSISFASNGVIDENKLKEIQNMDYNDFKKALKVKNDFCIYIEDENGDIILAKGPSKLDGKSISCGE